MISSSLSVCWLAGSSVCWVSGPDLSSPVLLVMMFYVSSPVSHSPSTLCPTTVVCLTYYTTSSDQYSPPLCPAPAASHQPQTGFLRLRLAQPSSARLELIINRTDKIINTNIGNICVFPHSPLPPVKRRQQIFPINKSGSMELSCSMTSLSLLLQNPASKHQQLHF